MGLFDGNGFQGPGEEFGNSWDSFRTGQGNFMTGPDGSKSDAFGNWTGGHHVSGPMQHSMVPQVRPPLEQLMNPEPPQRRRGLFGNMGLLSLLLGRG